MFRLHNFDTFNRIFESIFSGSSIIIGDSLTPLIGKHIKNASLLSNNQGKESLWEGGVGVKWLKRAIDAYPIKPNISNVVITIGTNGGFNKGDDVPGLFASLKRKFPNAKFIIIQGSWGWGGNKGIILSQVQEYYKEFSEQGGIVIDPPIGFSATDREAHQDRPILSQIGKVVDGLILQGSPSSSYTTAVVPSAPTIIQSETGIIYRPGDPYRYKVVNDHWLAKKDNQNKWFEITGSDYRSQFQSSIDLLDRENPNARSAKAPQRTVSGGSNTIVKTQADTGEEDKKIISPSGQGKDPESLDPKISKEFNFHLIPDGKGTNYRSAQFTPEVMKNILPKYGIKNVIRFNGNENDGKHRENHPSTSIATEERILKDLDIKFYKLSSTRNQREVNELLSKGNTLIHCAHGADRTGGNVGGYLYLEKPNSNLTSTDAIWRYTTQYNGWNKMSIRKPRSFSKGYLQQAQKFGVRDLSHAQDLSRKYSK